MTITCSRLAPDAIDLYFYDELAPAEHAAVAAHLAGCLACRSTLSDLQVIADALDGRSIVDAPPGSDWSGFTQRLRAAIDTEPRVAPAVHAGGATPARVITWLAAAAILSLATTSVALRQRLPRAVPPAAALVTPSVPSTVSAGTTVSRTEADPGFVALSEQHFERSKLVVLGLATKDPRAPSGADWQYERELASTLLPDTRLYRRAAQDRGLTQLAGVMSDLELVLLQASLSDDRDTQTLPQIQRLIRKRDLMTKMEVVGETYH